ncbi:MAG: helix-turn-helix transcriptional regulator [Phenylobacterium sp.]|nr:helix-turn-helix transcriptional regulator [Phenylobacterium sp.]MBP9231456.1 helix-turn-helix transcriptional regulator [Phenylobacterium sp.]MBP9754299.1 helix-turn-helix transcriptional regulator [Phenylobacterium sp.]
MDDDPSGGLQSQGALLGAALRGIRKARGLRTSQVADAIGLPLRTYQRLEEGSGPFELDRIKLFADFTDSDPFAIVASIWLQSPEFAVRAIDTKPLVVFTLALREFHEDLEDDIRLIEPRVWWGGFRRLFQDMTEHVRKRDLTAETWLDEQSRRLGLNLNFLPHGRGRRRD